MSAVMERGRPWQVTTRSAVRQAAARSAVREWHTVTVASRASSSWDTGRPTVDERPTTVAAAPRHSKP